MYKTKKHMENVALYDNIILLVNVTAISVGHGNKMFGMAYETSVTHSVRDGYNTVQWHLVPIGVVDVDLTTTF